MSKKINKKLNLSANKAKTIILSPIITEKSTLINQFNKVAFRVHVKSNSIEIKQAIEKLFKVKVEKVNTLVSRGKVKIFKGTVGKRSNFKKAIVNLAEGNTIDVSTGI